MNDGFAWWLVVLGIAIGISLVWTYMVRLPRTEADEDETEMTAEADWISRTIERDGGIAPSPLVEEVLVLHRQYLGSGALPPSGADTQTHTFADGTAEPVLDVPVPPRPGSPLPVPMRPMQREAPGPVAERAGE